MAVGSNQQVKFRFPLDMRSGDMITGTVTVEPKAKGNDNNRSSSTLEGMVIEIDGKKTKANNHVLSFIVPAGVTSLPFLLKNAAGEVIGQVQVQVKLSNISYLTPNASAINPAQTFFPETIAEPGQMLSIPGFFDGNAANTGVSLNGQACEIIAESPRGCYVSVPQNIAAGATNINIQENNTKEEHKINVVKLDLTAPKTNLSRGEKTTINVSVTGLEGIGNNGTTLKLSLTNQSPQTIAFTKETGNVITKEINAKTIKNGSYEFSTRIIALTAGVFTVGANIADPKNSTDCANNYIECIKKADADYERESKKCTTAACTALCISTTKGIKDACYTVYQNCLKNK